MRRTVLLILWLLTDYAVFCGAYAVAYFVRVGWIFSTDLPFRQFMAAVAFSGIPLLLFLTATRTFALARNQRTLRNGAYIAASCIIGLTSVVLGYFFVYQQIFSRELLLTACALNIVGTWATHMVMGLLMRWTLRRPPPVYPTLVIGVTHETRALLKLLRERRSVLVPVAILDASGVSDKEIEGVPVRGKLDKLEDVLKEKKITHVLQCSDLEQSINLLSACRSHGITYMLLPSVLGIVERDERMESLEGKAVTVVSPPSGPLAWFLR